MKQIKLMLAVLLAIFLMACGAEEEAEQANQTEVEVESEAENQEEAAEEMKTEIEGYVLQIEAKRFLLLETDSESLYEEAKDLSMEKLLQQENLPLIYVNYTELDELKEGDQIEVKFNGVMTFSIPGQINADSVEVID